jgi:hypothetical protein
VPAHQLIVCTPAERQGVEPPKWALQPVPEVTTLGPPITARRSG